MSIGQVVPVFSLTAAGFIVLVGLTGCGEESSPTPEIPAAETPAPEETSERKISTKKVIKKKVSTVKDGVEEVKEVVTEVEEPVEVFDAPEDEGEVAEEPLVEEPPTPDVRGEEKVIPIVDVTARMLSSALSR